MQKLPLPASHRVLFAVASLLSCAAAFVFPAAGPASAMASTKMPVRFSLMAASSAEVTATAYVRREENSGRLVYIGPWRQSSSASLSGGRARSTPTKGAFVSARFNGSAIRWIGSVGTGLGKAAVYLDGRLVANVDQSAAKYASKRIVWSSGVLPYGTHRLEIRALGQAGKKGSGRDVMVDALDVRGGSLVAPTVPDGFLRIQESDGRLTLYGTWSSIADASASSGSYRRSATAGSGYKLAFKGTAVALSGPVGPALGKGSVYLDGRLVATIDQKAATTRQNQPLWSAVGLTNAGHLVELRPYVTFGSVGKIAVDAAYVSGSFQWAPRRVEESDSKLGSAGAWSRAGSSGASGDAYRFCATGGGAISLRFAGSAVSVLGLKSSTSGEADFILDGASQGIVSLYASSTKARQVIWSASGLSAGEHVLEIRALGTAVSASRGERVGIDAFDVSGSVLQASHPLAFTPVEEDDARLSASGSWKRNGNSRMSSTAYMYSTDSNGALTFDFVGTGFRWIGSLSPECGSAKVLVDGDLKATASQTSDKTAYRREIYRLNGLTPGPHQVTIRVADAAPGAPRKLITVDALHVIGGPLTESERPSGVARVQASDGRTARVGTWASAAPSGEPVSVEMRTRDVRSRFETRFRGSSVTWIGSRGPAFGIAEVFVDGKSAGTVDLYDYAIDPGRTLWSSSTLPWGEHSLSIRMTGRHASRSSSFELGVTGLDVRGSLLESGAMFEHDDWRMLYKGMWASRVTTVGGADVMTSQVPSATATLRFSGTRLRLRGLTAPYSGIASISVDGGPYVGADLYSPGATDDVVVFDSGVLKQGTHTVKLVVTGRRNSSSTGRHAAIDGFEISDGTLLPQTVVQTARLKALDTAIKQLGKRYVWAGVGPTVFDCSGLVLYSYKAAGISLPHYSGSQWRLCDPKPVSQLLPGDLCFSDNPSRIHHVGMYIGDGVTINAPGAGRFVEYRAASTYGCFGRLKTSLWPD